MRRSGPLGLVLSVLFAATGCDITSAGPIRKDLKASDNDALNPGGRVSFSIIPRHDPARQGLLELATENPSSASAAAALEPEANAAVPPPTGPEFESENKPLFQPTVTIELDHRTGIGHEDGDFLSGAYFVDHDGRTVVGPETLDQDFTLHLTTANVGVGVRFFDMISAEALGGIATSALHYVLRTPTERAGDTSVGLGVNGGGRITFMPHPVVGIYAQGQLHLLNGIKKNHDTIVVPSAEVGSNLHLTRNVSLFGGWRWWNYSENIEGESDLEDLQVEGPTFGAALRF